MGGGYVVVEWATVLHEQRVITDQELRASAQFLCHADGGCPLRFLDFDAGELAWSIACPT